MSCRPRRSSFLTSAGMTRASKNVRSSALGTPIGRPSGPSTLRPTRRLPIEKPSRPTSRPTSTTNIPETSNDSRSPSGGTVLLATTAALRTAMTQSMTRADETAADRDGLHVPEITQRLAAQKPPSWATAGTCNMPETNR